MKKLLLVLLLLASPALAQTQSSTNAAITAALAARPISPTALTSALFSATGYTAAVQAVANAAMTPNGAADATTLLGQVQSVRAGQIVNVLDNTVGAKGDGVTDDAPALQALASSAAGKTIFFPPGRTYYLCTFAPSIYQYNNNAAIAFSNQSNFHVIASGASFKICPQNSPRNVFLMDRSSHWTWDGGTVVGDRSLLYAGAENAAFALFNNVDFRLAPDRCTGFGGVGACVGGDYNVHGRVEKMFMDGVGICADMAFSQDVVFSGIKAVGADTNGNEGPGQIGQKCVSNIFDQPNAPTLTITSQSGNTVSYSVYPSSSAPVVGTAYPVYGANLPAGTTLTPTAAGTGTLSQAPSGGLGTITLQWNFTGYSIQDTDRVLVADSDVSNFATAFLLASGSHFTYRDNFCHDNPGIGGSTGTCYLVTYFAPGNGVVNSSAGHPVNGVAVEGGHTANNGFVTGGYQVLINTASITNSDVISNVSVAGVDFDNNNSVAIGVNGPRSGLANCTIGINSYNPGTHQTGIMNAAALAACSSMQFTSVGGLTVYATGASSDIGFTATVPSVAQWSWNVSQAGGNEYLTTPSGVGGQKTPFSAYLDGSVSLLGALDLLSTPETSSFTFTSTMQMAVVDATNGPVVGALPPCAAATAGREYRQVKADTTTNAVSFAPSGADKIRGTNASFLVGTTQGAYLTLRCNGTATGVTAGWW